MCTGTGVGVGVWTVYCSIGSGVGATWTGGTTDMLTLSLLVGISSDMVEMSLFRVFFGVLIELEYTNG